jgi:hypothetical protein
MNRSFQTFVTIVLMLLIAIAGYIIGHDQPVPAWIEHRLMPGLGWLGFILLTIVIIHRLRTMLVSGKDQP